jgi:hypothetical protein
MGIGTGLALNRLCSRIQQDNRQWSEDNLRKLCESRSVKKR